MTNRSRRRLSIALRRLGGTLAAMALLVTCGRAQVVINEIYYHAPDDLDELQWIELHNAGAKEVDLSGWQLTKAIKFAFPAGTAIPAHGFVVVCRNQALFAAHYPGVAVAGEFKKSLKHSGETIALGDRNGDVVDNVTFGNKPPWPLTPDGHTASLERICPTAGGQAADNWAASTLGESENKPAGTPGQPNSVFAARALPVISNVSFTPELAAPNQPIQVQARVEGPSTIKAVKLLYRIVSPGAPGEEQALEMKAAAAAGAYTATIPGQALGRIVRFRVQATDEAGSTRSYPAANDLRPALACLVQTNAAVGKVPWGEIVHLTPGHPRPGGRRPMGGPGRGGPPDEEQMARFGMEMQLRTGLDLPTLWTSLTMSNTDPAVLEKLRPIFTAKSAEREALAKQTLAATNAVAASRALPGELQKLKTGLATALTPLLTPDQATVLQKWGQTENRGQGPFGFGGDPAMMLRQFIPLESAYLHLATRTNVEPKQLAAVREVYREAIRERDGMAGQAGRMMGPPGGDEGGREDFMGRIEALQGQVENKLAKALTAAQLRELAAWREADQPGFMGFGRGGSTHAPARGEDAFVYYDPATGRPHLFDFVHVPERSGGWKVHFNKDQALNGMTGINLIFEASDRWVLAEPLAYEFHRRAGLAAPLTDYVRLWVDGQPLGYHLLIEQPNKSFLRRNGVRDDGNLYKANWRGRGLTGQHEKRINATPGHEDLVALVDQLGQTKADPAAQWKLIEREFDVNEVATHYAARILLSDWDGFFNNYFLYHDLKGTKKWTFYPWDQDQTWGDPGGFGGMGGLVIELPLTFGGEGDRPPGWRGERPPTGMFFGGGGAMWWRAGGYISKPLLVNPEFRRVFLARMRDLLQREFTEERLFPLIEQYGTRLEGEVTYRAEANKEDPAQARQRLRTNLDSLKQFVTRRRQWLLQQDELKTVAAATPPAPASR